MAEAVYYGMFNTFITIYYNQAVGLSNTLIGTAIMLAMIGDAITDPVVGIISDRWHSKHGRRHPFLFVAPVPLAIALYMIFNPPAGLTGDLPRLRSFHYLRGYVSGLSSVGHSSPCTTFRILLLAVSCPAINTSARNCSVPIR